MNLLEQDAFRACLSGCVRLVSADDGVRLHRHTAKQISYYEATNDAWAIRAHCPAGIKLNLCTDSPTVDLRGRILPGARTYAGFDVEIDGCTSAAIRIEATEAMQSLRLVDSATRAKRQISITFPQSAVVELHAIELQQDSINTPPDGQQPKYLALGDSITQGMDARGPAAAYPLQLARMLDVELLNLGVGGHIFDLDALDDELPYRPDIVTVAYGTNDWSRGTTREQIEGTVEAYLTRLTQTVAQSSRIYVLTPIWRAVGDDIKAGGTLAQFSTVIAEAAARFAPVTVVDGMTLVPHRPELFADGTHPNDEGFLHYSINLARAINLQ
jgi:lysophospholipase L1-like esterase